MKNFPNQVFTALHDKGHLPALENIPFDEQRFKELNNQGYGIFFTPNSFSGGRKLSEGGAAKLLRINAIYGDLDVAKDGDGMAHKEIDCKKGEVIAALNAYCPPSVIIGSRNGIYPLWYVNEEGTDNETLTRRTGISKGLIAWSKLHGCAGDRTHEVNRLIRLPGYYHNKQEPYMVKVLQENDRIYTLEELVPYFWEEEKLADFRPVKTDGLINADPIIQAVNNLDIRRVITEALKEIGHTATFNRLNHLAIDGEVHGLFVNRDGGNFLAPSGGCSHYKVSGNAVTVVAGFLGVDNKEAFKWILRKFGVGNDYMSQPVRATGENTAAIYTKLKEGFFYEDKRGNKKVSPFGIQSIANYFVTNYHVKSIGDYRNREIYVYKNGKYDEQGVNFFHAEVEKILGEACTIHFQNEIIEKIKNLTFINREEFKAPDELMNFANGVYNFHTNELLPHDPKYYFAHQIPVHYNPAADCPEIKKFLSEVFNPNDIPVIQEWIGYILYRRYFIKKALILFGLGNTGKTTLINVLTKFYGEENITDIPLQKIGGDKFASAALNNKHVNLCDDLSSTDISENGMFKMATGGGNVPAERKYGDPFSFKNYAKLVFACNKIPSPKDTDDDAYFDRWVLINLTRPIAPDKRDPFLGDKLTTNTELSGLLNFGLEGLRRIMCGRFSYKKETYEVKVEMLKSNSSIAWFAYDQLEKNEGSWISKDSMYQTYVSFVEKMGLATETKEKFGRDIIKYAGYIVDSKGIEITEKKTGWRNVVVKNNENDEFTI